MCIVTAGIATLPRHHFARDAVRVVARYIEGGKLPEDEEESTFDHWIQPFEGYCPNGEVAVTALGLRSEEETTKIFAKKAKPVSEILVLFVQWLGRFFDAENMKTVKVLQFHPAKADECAWKYILEKDTLPEGFPSFSFVDCFSLLQQRFPAVYPRRKTFQAYSLENLSLAFFPNDSVDIGPHAHRKKAMVGERLWKEHLSAFRPKQDRMSRSFLVRNLPLFQKHLSLLVKEMNHTYKTLSDKTGDKKYLSWQTNENLLMVGDFIYFGSATALLLKIQHQPIMAWSRKKQIFVEMTEDTWFCICWTAERFLRLHMKIYSDDTILDLLEHITSVSRLTLVHTPLFSLKTVPAKRSREEEEEKQEGQIYYPCHFGSPVGFLPMEVAKKTCQSLAQDIGVGTFLDVYTNTRLELKKDKKTEFIQKMRTSLLKTISEAQVNFWEQEQLDKDIKAFENAFQTSSSS